MSATRRKRKAAKKNIPPIYSYPQYGYTQPQPVQPDSQQVQPESEYVYYPADQYGNIIGPPVNYPPIDNRNYQEPYPYSNYPSNIPTYGSYVDTPRRNRRYYDNYYYNYPRPDYPYNNRGESRHESLPPIRYQALPSPRTVSSNYNGYQRYNVRNLTEQGSTSSPRERKRLSDF